MNMINHPSFSESGCGASWKTAIEIAEDSTAVVKVTGTGPVTVVWCDGEREEIENANALINAVRAMEQN